MNNLVSFIFFWIFVQIPNDICRCLATSFNSCDYSLDWICHWAHHEAWDEKDMVVIFIFGMKLELMQEAPPGGQIWNQCKCLHF